MTRRITKLQDRNELLTALLAEECGEVVQRACKVLRWGMDDKNYTKLHEEIGDVIGVIDLLAKHNVIDLGLIDERRVYKVNKIMRYHADIIEPELNDIPSEMSQKAD
jgi:NTP pyrophosphatase (non-canonical NTP hydrolase)